MSTPHTCPTCDGTKRVPAPQATSAGASQPCPTCNATGVVWSAEEAAAAAGSPLDINGL